ncbi:hypothetical protein STEG23_026031, partial [Scotinomys teguina]
MDTWEVASRESAKFGHRIPGARSLEGLSSHGTNERFYPALLGHTTRQNHYRALLKITGIVLITITIGKNYINNVYPFAFDKFRENNPIFILS